MAATTPADRRTLLARTIADHRSRDDGATFVGTDGERRGRVVYGDRVLKLVLPGDDRAETSAAALDEVLGGFPVFKRKQPETRKAPDGTVYVSALADPKHCADFVETVLREVYGLDEAYELVAEPGSTEPGAGDDETDASADPDDATRG